MGLICEHKEVTIQEETQHIIDWIKEYFIENGPESKAIIGISGGKDSTIVAKLCVEALGKNRVLGVLMPQGKQHDLDTAIEVCEWLDIDYTCLNIEQLCEEFYATLDLGTWNLAPTPQVTSNSPARLRMAILYAVAAIKGGRVANTCNRSENYIGYSTKYGDHAGDFAPIKNYTVRELMEIGQTLFIPAKFLNKTPEDGLSGLTDEENLGFTYKQLDAYLLDNEMPDYETLKNIKNKYKNNLHKMNIYLPCPHNLRNTIII